MQLHEMAGAELSDCGRYRYRLWRRWGSGQHVLWVMLNPSTADALKDDPTIRRCAGFTRAWGYDGFRVVNLIAYRAATPLGLYLEPAAFDERNPTVVAEEIAAEGCGLVVVAWGAGAQKVFGREAAGHLELMVREASPRSLHCLGVTKAGHPRHPLYVPKAAELQPWPADKER